MKSDLKTLQRTVEQKDSAAIVSDIIRIKNQEVFFYRYQMAIEKLNSTDLKKQITELEKKLLGCEPTGANAQKEDSKAPMAK